MASLLFCAACRDMPMRRLGVSRRIPPHLLSAAVGSTPLEDDNCEKKGVVGKVEQRWLKRYTSHRCHNEEWRTSVSKECLEKIVFRRQAPTTAVTTNPKILVLFRLVSRAAASSARSDVEAAVSGSAGPPHARLEGCRGDSLHLRLQVQRRQQQLGPHRLAASTPGAGTSRAFQPSTRGGHASAVARNHSIRERIQPANQSRHLPGVATSDGLRECVQPANRRNKVSGVTAGGELWARVRPAGGSCSVARSSPSHNVWAQV